MRLRVYVILLTAVGIGIWVFRPGIKKTLLQTDITVQGMATAEAFAGFVQNGDLESVRTYLKAGMSPDTIYRNDPVLFLALYENHFPIVEALLNAGANPNQKDSLGNTPLIVAASMGDYPVKSLEVVQALLNKGADPGMRDAKGLLAVDRAWNRVNTNVALFLEKREESGHQDESSFGFAPDSTARAQELLMEIGQTQNQKKLAELIRLGEDGARAVVEGCTDSNQMIRHISRHLLPKMGPLSATHREPIQNLYEDKTQHYRQQLAEGLINTAQTPKEKVKILMHILDDDDTQILHMALRRLGELGPTAKPAIPKLKLLVKKIPLFRRPVQWTIDKINGG